MKVLITGAGSVGRLAAASLHEQGHDITLVDISKPAALPEGVRFESADVTALDRLTSIITSEGITDIVHTAALLSTAIRRNPLKGYEVNTLGTANVLEAARTNQVRRVVLASSTTVEYSTFGSHAGPVIEEDFPARFLSERPQSIYVATKVANEQLGLLYHDLYGVDVVILRFGAVISPWVSDQPTSVPDRLLTTLVRAGAAGSVASIEDPVLVWGGREEFVDVRDCAGATVAALAAPEPTQRVYNVASGEWHSFEEFVATVKESFPELDVEVTAIPTGGFAGFAHERPAKSATAAAREELNFVARHPLASTVQSCLTSL